MQTANGQNFANSIGVPAPPMTAEQSAGAILAQVESFISSGSCSVLIIENRLIERPRPQLQELLWVMMEKWFRGRRELSGAG